MQSWFLVFILILGLSSFSCQSGAKRSEASPVSGDVSAKEPSSEFNESVETNDSDVIAEDVTAGPQLAATRPWVSTSYAGQVGALGWTPATFSVPQELGAQVRFWIDIYSKYTTDQGVIHDEEDVSRIFSILDFSDLKQRTDLSAVKKERLRRERIRAAKAQVRDIPKKQVRFQLGQKDRVIQGIFYSGRYLKEFEQIFREQGLPLELTRLPFVESSFNVLARSKVGASGLWQIMRRTGKPHLMINEAVDKRNHPVESAKLAAQILRSNYQLLESWPLAVTAYNHGPTGVLRLTKIHQSKELSDLMKKEGNKKRLGFASRNFFPSFLAILEVEGKATQYLGPVVTSQPLPAKRVLLRSPLKYRDLLEMFRGDEEILQIYNPHLNRKVRQGKLEIPPKTWIEVPPSAEIKVQ